VSPFDLPKIHRSRKPLAAWLLAIVAGLLGATLVIVVTQSPGPGIEPDSTSYVGAGESFARHATYRVPMSDWQSPDSTAPLSHFPPGYPTAIALPILAGIPAVQSARVVNAVAAFIDVGLATLLVASATGLGTAAIAAVAILVMRPFVLNHLSMLSEPLFLAVLVATLALMALVATATDPRQQARRAFVAGLLGAAATLTRYAGVAIGGAVVLWMIILPGSLRARLRRGAIALLPQGILVGAWLVHVHRTSGVHAIRSIGTYGGFGATLRMGAATTVAWLVPLSADQSLPGRRWLALLLLIALAAITGAGTRRAAPPTRAVVAASFTLAICYALVIVVSRLLADPGIPFDERILIPLFTLALIVAALAAHGWWAGVHLPARIIGAIILVGWLVASASASYDEADAALDTGVDFAQDDWRDSPLVAWARDSAAHQQIYTNWPPVMFFHAGRASHELPDASRPDILRAFADTLRARHGAALVFEQRNPDFIGPADLLGVPGLRRVATFPDGSVFAPAP